MKHVFICYSRKDKVQAEEFGLKLQGRGFDVWMDKQMNPGAVWESEILQNIRECGVFTVLMSANSSESEWVKREITIAEALGKLIIPILLSGKPFERLSKYQHVDMTNQGELSPQLIAQISQMLSNPMVDSIGKVKSDEDKLAEIDLLTLKRLWKYISWEKVHSLLQGYADGKIFDEWLLATDLYEDMRRNPKNHLYDEDLENKLREFDTAYFDTLQRGGELFCEARVSEIYVPTFRRQSYPHKRDGRQEYEEFIRTNVKPTYHLYQEFVDMLKECHIYHKLLGTSD